MLNDMRKHKNIYSNALTMHIHGLTSLGYFGKSGCPSTHPLVIGYCSTPQRYARITIKLINQLTILFDLLLKNNQTSYRPQTKFGAM